MTSDRDLIGRLLLEALSRSNEQEREEYLRSLELSHAAEAAEVRELAYWGQQAADSLTSSWRPAPEPDVGALVDGYELVALLGEGGFGRVWRAKARKEGLRDVALKLVKEGVDTRWVLKRFGREKDVLSKLEHTGIAAIQDAGRTESGRPFIVMQLVPGVPITQFVADRGLDIRASIELMVAVCRAVEYAHGQGVLHRDLKPSNILVAEEDGRPQPKVIDFGIASMLTSDERTGPTATDDGRVVGSPPYMSPEQAGYRSAGQSVAVDERGDVFSLGRILYELVVGAPAVTLDHSTPAQALRQLEAAFDRGSPSPLAAARAAGRPAVAPDLDRVILAATAVELSQRYDSVTKLREDLLRYLRGEPVLARTPGVMERAGRFVRKHRPVLAPAALLIAVLGGSLAYVAGARHRTVRANERLTQTIEVQSGLIEGLDVAAIGRTLREEVLRQLGAGIDAGDDREATLAKVAEHVDFTTLARGVIARNVLDPAEAALEQQLGGDKETRLTLANVILEVRRRQGLLDSRGRTATTIHELTSEVYGDDSSEAVEILLEIANVASRQGRIDEAEDSYRQALERSRALFGPESDQALRCEHGLASQATIRNDYAGAEASLLEIVGRLEAAGRAETPLMAQVLLSLGQCQERALHLGDAAATFERARALVTAGHAGDALPDYAVEISLARVRASQGQPVEALTLLDEVVPPLREKYGDAHSTTLAAVAAWSVARFNAGDHQGALEAATIVYEAQRGLATRTHPETLRLLANRVKIMNVLSRFEEVEAILTEELPLARTALTPNHVVVGELLLQRATALGGLARIDECWETLQSSIAVFERVLSVGHPRLQLAYAVASQFNASRHELHPEAGYDVLAAEYAAKLEPAGETIR
ncbi:MAG: serine/threonine-protein kinase [Planctomycetota bacterium]